MLRAGSLSSSSGHPRALRLLGRFRFSFRSRVFLPVIEPVYNAGRFKEKAISPENLSPTLIGLLQLRVL